MRIDEELLKILACPECKFPVQATEKQIICQNPKCGLRYPIREGIPVMLKEEAEKPEN